MQSTDWRQVNGLRGFEHVALSTRPSFNSQALPSPIQWQALSARLTELLEFARDMDAEEFGSQSDWLAGDHTIHVQTADDATTNLRPFGQKTAFWHIRGNHITSFGQLA